MLTTCKSTCAIRIRIQSDPSNCPPVREFFQTTEVLECVDENYSQADLLIFVKNQLQWLQKLASNETGNDWIVIFNVDFNWLDRYHFTFSMTCGKVCPENQYYYFPFCLCNSQVNAQSLINAFELG